MKKNISLLILVAMLITIHPVSFANVQMIDKTISSEDKIFNSEYIPSSEVRIVENSVDVNFIIKPNDISLFSNEKGLFDCGSDYAYRDFAIRSNAEKKQAVYNKLLEVCKAFSTDNQDVPETEDGYIIKELPLLEYNLSVDDVSEVYFMFRQDHPEFYWLSYSITTSYKLSWDTLDYVVSDLYIEIFSDYANGNERSKLNRSIMQSVEKYAGIANKYSSEFEKVLSLHDAIIDDVDYDSSSGSAGHNIVGILDGESNSGTMCEGYAKTYQLVLNYLDIDNVYISGTGNNVGHAWNAVKMEDGKYYCVDLTWDDQPKLPNGRIYDFFLTSNAVNPSRTPHSPNGTGTDFQYSLPSISHNDYVPGYIKCDSIDYLKYSIKDDGTIFITDCDKGAYGVFEIPSEIDSMMVTGIGPMVFQNCRLLRKVIVPKGIVDIYFYAFMHCVNISEIQLPDSVEFIGNSAFKECTALSQITIPENVTNIPPNAFAVLFIV